MQKKHSILPPQTFKNSDTHGSDKQIYFSICPNTYITNIYFKMVVCLGWIWPKHKQIVIHFFKYKISCQLLQSIILHFFYIIMLLHIVLWHNDCIVIGYLQKWKVVNTEGCLPQNVTKRDSLLRKYKQNGERWWVWLIYDACKIYRYIIMMLSINKILLAYGIHNYVLHTSILRMNHSAWYVQIYFSW